MSRKYMVAILGLAIAATFVAGLLVGPAMLPPREVWQALTHPATRQDAVGVIVWEARLPRICLAFAVGAALSVAGVIMQGLFQNAMAAPCIIGVSAGASLGATVAIVSGLARAGTWLSLPGSAFIGAMLAAVLVYVLSRRGGRTPVAVLLLTGIAVGSLCSALSALLMIRGQRGDMDLVILWMLGSLANRGWAELALITPYVVLGVLLATIFARYLDVLCLGDEQAAYLGLEVERARMGFIAAASLLAAAAVAVSGIIGFVGLVVPHMTRLMFGVRHRALVPAAAAAGMVTLAGADLVANVGGEMPVGIVTALLGAPFFLWLLRQRRAECA